MTYLNKAMNYPLLDEQQELSLADRWLNNRDQSAFDKLVISHLRMVIKIASHYKDYGLSFDDLVAEGNLGLIHAINRFNPERGFRLSTYARWWIRASIQEYLMKSWSLVKIGTTKNQKKLFFSLRQTKARLRIYDEGYLDDDQIKVIAKELDVPEEDVLSMNQRLYKESSLNARIDTASEDMEWQDTLVSDMDDPETILIDYDEVELKRSKIKQAMKILNKRERKILHDRYLSDKRITLREIGERFGVSTERVRQVEARAIAKLKQAIGPTEQILAS